MSPISFMVRLRLKRIGRKKYPVYRIIAIDSRCRRDGAALKELGFYNPLKNDTQLDIPSIKYYLQNGAQPSQTVSNILKKARVYN